MRKFSLLFLFCAFSIMAMATSTPSGTKERTGRMEVTPGMATPSPATLQGEVTDDMLAAETATEAVVENTAAENSIATEAPAVERVIHFDNVKKQQRFDKKVEKVKNRIEKKNDGGNVISILALVFGILGFLVAWFFFPLGLLFAIAAIVLGAIGMGRGEGRGMAIVGLIMGILTILIPVLIVAIVLAILL